jgi:hypothetical protein
MKRHILAISAVLSIAVTAGVFALPVAMASTAKSDRERSVQMSFAAKDKEISDLKHQVALLQANIISLNQKIDQLEQPPAPAAGTIASSNASEPVKISEVHAQRYDGANSQGDTMWLLEMTITNGTGLPVQAPSVEAKFSDGSVEAMLPYGGMNGYDFAVATPEIVKPFSGLRVKYFFSSHFMGSKTPVSARLTLGASEVTVPIKSMAPTLLSSP